MKRITPFLWFDNNAEEAINFYVSLFKNSKIGSNVTRYDKAGAAATGQSEGSIMTVPFQLEGIDFAAINAGPHFKFNPSVSFYAILYNENEVDKLWGKLKEGGKVLMELQKYDWSDKYGWIQDRFGLSWQVSVGKKDNFKQPILPFLLFVGKQFGKAEEAINYYTSIFKNSSVNDIMHYKSGEQESEGALKFSQFTLDGLEFCTMESSYEHAFTFNEAISFVVNCKDQEEIDYYWNKLSEGGDPNAQQCGWLKDKFGLSWQIVPVELSQLLSDPDKAQSVMKAVLQMKKLNINELKNASIKEIA